MLKLSFRKALLEKITLNIYNHQSNKSSNKPYFIYILIQRLLYNLRFPQKIQNRRNKGILMQDYYLSKCFPSKYTFQFNDQLIHLVFYSIWQLKWWLCQVILVQSGILLSNNTIFNMKNRRQVGAKQNYQGEYFNQQSSYQSIPYGKQQSSMLSPQRSRQLLVDQQKQNIKRAKKQGLDHLYKQNYQPAKYSKAVDYRNSRSYMKRLPSGHYKELDLFADTEELKYFGIGTYYYIEFFRRIVWLFFIMTLVAGVTIYMNWLGEGMTQYSESFSTYLIKSTVGNYSENKLTDYDNYIVTIAPAANFLMFFIFYIVWKAHFFKCIADQEEDNSDVKPDKFCLQIEGIDEGQLKQEDLTRFFSSFGPVFQVSLVRRYKNKLSYFQELDQLQEQIKQEQLEVILGGGDREDVELLKKQKEKLLRYINTLKIHPKTISVFVHFQYEKSKADCLTYFNNHYLFNTCSHNCMRSCCCCCVDQPEEKYLYNGTKLFIKSDKVPNPEDINWSSFELSFCSKFFRGCFSLVIILIFLGVSCAIIGLCSIYISSHASDCQNLTVPTTLAQAQASTVTSDELQCYCEANFINSFNDGDINSVCGNKIKEIGISQGIQYAVTITSGVTNFIFGLIVHKLVNFVRPNSKSAGLLTKTTIYTIFIIFNSIFVPLLIYADIFGFQASNYVSFITIISTDVKSFFSVENLSFYPDFDAIWYKNVSVIYVNFIIIETVMTWVFYILGKCSSNKSLEDDQGKILQKSMNEQITSYKLDVYKQAANFYLIVIMISLFCVGIPVLLPLGMICLWSKYVTNRSLLQNNSSRIDGLGQDFSSLTLSLIPFILIASPLVGEWMLTANSDVYNANLPMNFPYFVGNSQILDRQFYLPFYLGVALIAFFQFFLYNTLIRCCSWMCSLCYQKKQTSHPYHTRPFAQYTKGMNILYSYNIRNNDEMRNVMLNLQKFLVDKEMD